MIETKENDRANFTPSVPFMMHRITARVVGEATKEFLGMGFSVQGARALMVLLQNPNMRVGTLAEIACIENSTLSHMLKRMTEEGLLVRERVEDDNRSYVVNLTDDGKRVANDCHKASLEHERMLLGGLDEREVVALKALLYKMHDNVEQVAAESQSAKKTAMRG